MARDVKRSVLGEAEKAEEAVDLNDFGQRDESGDDNKQVEPADDVVDPTRAPGIMTMLQQIARWMDDDAEGNEDAMERIVADIWEINSPDELLAGKKTQSGKDYVDQWFYVNRVTFAESDVEGPDSCPVYAVFHATNRDSGREQVVSCGGWRIVAEAAKARQLGIWPRACRIVNARKQAKGGKMPLKLEFFGA